MPDLQTLHVEVRIPSRENLNYSLEGARYFCRDAMYRFCVKLSLRVSTRSTPWCCLSGASGNRTHLSNTTVETGLSLFNPHLPSPPQIVQDASTLFDTFKKVISVRPIRFRKKLGPLCREMSPRDSFEFRLASRTEYRYAPHFDDPKESKKGLIYQVYNADWVSPSDEEFKKFVEDDDRYTVDWGSFVKDRSSNEYSCTILLRPKILLSRKATEQHNVHDTIDIPSDTAVLKKAETMLYFTDSAFRGITIDFRKRLGPLCLQMSPKDSFTFRLASRALFEKGPSFENPKAVENGLAYPASDIDWQFLFDEDFKTFVEDDDRYNVHWGSFVESGNGQLHGTIIFEPKSPLPHMLGVVEESATDKLGSSQGKVKNFLLFRRSLGQLCRTMSPEDSFLVRLNSRCLFDSKFDCTPSTLLNDGHNYQVNYTKFQFAVEACFKRFVEDDDRYVVNWGDFYAPISKSCCSISYKPNDVLHRPTPPNVLRATRKLFMSKSRKNWEAFTRNPILAVTLSNAMKPCTNVEREAADAVPLLLPTKSDQDKKYLPLFPSSTLEEDINDGRSEVAFPHALRSENDERPKKPGLIDRFRIFIALRLAKFIAPRNVLLRVEEKKNI
jgi:hypothetical protein